MTTLIVLPEHVFQQYMTDGVVFAKLCCVEYMKEVSSVNALADIQEAMQNFSIEFCPELDVTLADTPLASIAKRIAENGADVDQWTEFYKRLEGRAANIELRQGNKSALLRKYTLNPVDENLWVAVQQRLHDVTGDPGRLSIKVNSDFFDAVIAEATRSKPLEVVASTKVFTNYLESLRVD